MTATARTASIATAVLLVAGAGSGLLLDEREGAAGALEWVLRTAVVASAAVAVAAALLLTLRVRHRIRSRWLAWGVSAAAAGAFAFFVAQPTLYAVYLSHLPARRAVHDVPLGAAKEPVTLTTADGLRLRGWYVPSRNGAAVALLHGTGGNRLGVSDHARLLARHGYGVLLFDLRGHGTSDGRSTSLPSLFRRDADAALAYLQRRADVRAGRIGIVGVSLGGEIALDAAARDSGWRATVLEGVQGGSPADMRTAGADPATFAAISGMHLLGRVLGAAAPDAPNAELVERIAPRPLLLLSAGRGLEARANEAYARRGGELWNLPRATHAAALRTAPAEYERRLVRFLSGSLTAAT